MRKLRTVTAVVVLTIALTSGVIASSTSSHGASNYAAGKGINAAGEYFRFFAVDGLNGASGYARVKFPPSAAFPLGFDVAGEVACLAVPTPNTATVDFMLDRAEGSILPGAIAFHIAITDSTPDRVGTSFLLAPPECVGSGGLTPFTAGYVIIHQE